MRKIKLIRNLIILVLLALGARVFFIGFIKSEELAGLAVAQRIDSIPIKTMRGVIYDRQMRAITEGHCTLYAAVVPTECTDKDEISRLIGHPLTNEDIQVFPLNTVTEQQAKLVKMKGVSLFNVSSRYSQNGFLSHVIGYTSDDGGLGIEQACSCELEVQESDSISMIKNANEKMLTGLGFNKTNKKAYKGVKLSIDYHIQKVVEDAMDKGTKSGAAVVVDVSCGDILAMVSRPSFSQSQIAKYLMSEEGEFINRALTPFDIGSVFKTVVAAAALEQGGYTPGTVFTCTGKTNIQGKEFECNAQEGHGNLTFEQGFALSCNTVFYKIGQSLGAERIYDCAKGFGFLSPVLDLSGLWEKGGYVPSETNARELANISIGQGEVSVTPLAVADMFCTIANNGLRRKLTLVRGIVDEHGASADFPHEVIGRVIDKKTAVTLQRMLKAAVENGTGKRADIAGWGAAGKTGSAQTGWEKDGELLVHGWFGGYFPAEVPRFVCVVLCQNGKTGANSAAPIFKEIGEGIKDLINVF